MRTSFSGSDRGESQLKGKRSVLKGEKMRLVLAVAILGAMLLGGSVTKADPFPANTGVITSSSTAFSETTGSGTVAGTLKSWVLNTVSGNLIFAWQLVMDAGSKAIGRLTIEPFLPEFSPVAGHTAEGAAGATIAGSSASTGAHAAPTSFGYDPSQNLVIFNFLGGLPALPSLLGGGEVSNLLWATTTAPFFLAGGAHIIDGFTVDVSTFVPAVPEPASLLLLGTGLLGFAGLARRKFQGKKNVN